MNKREVLAALIDKKKAGILHILLNASEEMYLKEIAQKSGVSITSTFRILQEFVDLTIIQRKEWKNSKVYFCEKNHLAFLKDLFLDPFDGVTEFVAAVKDVRGVKSIILHGTQQKGKANVLIIGENIDAAPIEEICTKLKTKSFELSYLTLGRNQYDQMIKMGLYAGEKKVLV
ncbi:MAG: helix-turn-helix domain-containing protein [Nanoarchaeota archaeon]|nr:helix-turn-helix domain-containing protein [Nanoarchaeota archaeon]